MKTLSYGIMHFTIATGVAYGLTGSAAIAIGIGCIEPAVQMVAYAIHERVWEKAKRKTPLAAQS